MCYKCVCIYTICMYHSAIKNETFPFVVTWIDVESIMLSEMGQTKKDKYCTVTLNMESKNNKTNKDKTETEL